MADSKLDALTLESNLDGTERLYVVKDYTGVPADRKTTVENVKAYISQNIQQSIAGVSYYLDTTVTQELTYNYLNRVPPAGAAITASASSSTGTGTLIRAFETAVGDPNSTTIPAGTYTFHGFGFRQGGGSGSYFVAAQLYLRTSGGVETLLFEILSDPVTSTTSGAPTEWLNEYFLSSNISKGVTDRLVIKLYARSSGSSRTVNVLTGGTLSSTHFITPILSSGGSSSGTNPGGTSGQVQYNTGSGFGGFTVNGDGTLDTSTGLLNVTGSTVSLVNSEASSSMVIGNAVYLSGVNEVKLARANSSTASAAVGFCTSTSVAAAGTARIQTNGIVTATTTQWDAVAGTIGGLTAGATYYLDPTNFGKITPTTPSTLGQYIVILGRAISTTQLLISIREPILL